LCVSVDNFNIYPNTRLGKLVKAKKLEDILEICDDFCPGEPAEYFFDRLAFLSTTIVMSYLWQELALLQLNP
jgi:hypothetical protein